jgi:hypothetical protein
MSTLMVAVVDPVSSTPSRETLLKPPSVNRTGVEAWAQILDAVLSGAVADGRADFLDQRRTRRLDGDAGQDAARRIADHARYCRLRMNARREKDQREEPEQQPRTTRLIATLQLRTDTSLCES